MRAAAFALLLGALVPATAAAASAPITYTAKVFMRGMTVTTPAGWRVHEDHPGEFNLAGPVGAMENIHFWLDPAAIAHDNTVLPEVGRTPGALITWLRSDSDFIVTVPTTRVIAGGLKTQVVDLDVAASAPRQDPGCPGPCLGEFAFNGPHYHFSYGTGRGEPIRLYFATLGSGATEHTLLISLDTPSARAFKTVLPVASRILASVRLPPRVTTG
jgi:hypothetical protein